MNVPWESITDNSNPFNKTGLSLEVRTQLDYLEAAKVATGVDVVCTSTTDHPVMSASGNKSRHRLPGTEGEGLALDCRLRTRGRDIHLAVFELWVPVEKQLAELIYAGATYNVKRGRHVARYAVSGHWDHVHSAVTKGVFVRWPGAPVPTPQPIPPATDQEDEVSFMVYRWPDGTGVRVDENGGIENLGSNYYGSVPALKVANRSSFTRARGVLPIDAGSQAAGYLVIDDPTGDEYAFNQFTLDAINRGEL